MVRYPKIPHTRKGGSQNVDPRNNNNINVMGVFNALTKLISRSPSYIYVIYLNSQLLYEGLQ